MTIAAEENDKPITFPKSDQAEAKRIQRVNYTATGCRFIPGALIFHLIQRTEFPWYEHSKAFDKYLYNQDAEGLVD